MNYIFNWLISLIFIKILQFPANIILNILRYISVYRIKFIKKVISILKRMPEDSVLLSENGQVYYISYDESGSEVPQFFYSGFLTWKEGRRLASHVLKASQKQLVITLAFWILIIPSIFSGLMYAIYIGIINESAWGIGLPACLIILLSIHQFEPYVIRAMPSILEAFNQK